MHPPRRVDQATIRRGQAISLASPLVSPKPPIPPNRVTGHVRLACFQADFSFLLGAGFANPGHGAALGDGSVFIEDKLDYLAAPKVETSAQPETFFRVVQDEARESLLVAVQVDDQTRASFRHHPLRPAALGDRKAGHSFTSQVARLGRHCPQ